MAEEVWRWPEELDALRAAPRQHRLMLENDRVRVLDTRVAAGDAAYAPVAGSPVRGQLE